MEEEDNKKEEEEVLIVSLKQLTIANKIICFARSGKCSSGRTIYKCKKTRLFSVEQPVPPLGWILSNSC